MDEYTLIYSTQFRKSLRRMIDYWKYSLLISDKRVDKYIKLICSSVETLKQFPYIYEDISDVYKFDQPTDRILIGDSYAIFYRMNEEKNIVLVGNVFGQRVMQVKL